MFPALHLDTRSDLPLYRQLHTRIKELIGSGALAAGERLPPTRELAGRLGLNRTTVSAAYALLEADGLVRGHVGRGSFVLGSAPAAARGRNWDDVFAPREAAGVPPPPPAVISFATSRPADELFPIDAFRAACDEVLSGPHAAAVLQLGSPAGYAPLRHFLLEDARRAGIAGPGDDVAITSGCQQAIDLLARVLVRPGDVVALEDPVYPGLTAVFRNAGAQLAGIPVGPDGLYAVALERQIARAAPRLIVLTPNFQNPTGTTMHAAARESVLRIARRAGTVVIENDIYGELRYEGAPLLPIKQLDDAGDTVLLRSFSKITFPGLRVGWIVGPRPLLARITEAKHLADLHTDQLSQAVLLRFAESGRLAEHRARVIAAGAERLRAVLDAAARFLPPGTRFTRPQGGMNVWVRLPEPLDAAEFLPRAEREGVAYVPGRYFAVTRQEPGGLRLSFAGLDPDKIRAGLRILGQVFSEELARARSLRDEAPAMV